MTQYPPVPSYYAASANRAPIRPALKGTRKADVCVVGAGYTGLSTALFLAEVGFRVVVLEAATVGWGASGRNGGQIVNSFSRDLDNIERQTTPDHLRLLAEMAFEGSQIIRQRVREYGIRCDLKEGGIFAALNPRQQTHLEGQQTLWQRFGYHGLELLDREAIRARAGTDRYVGGAIDHTGGHIHPLNLALGEAAALESRGGVIHEHSEVTAIVPGDPATVKTHDGEVRAQFVVLAGNAYLGGLVPELGAKSMPCGSQIIATEPQIGRLLEEKLGEAVLGYYKNQLVGFAYFCMKSSAFTGRSGLYIDGFLVDSEVRHQGFGKIIMGYLCTLALQRNCQMMEWGVLDWNAPTIKFYRGLGAYSVDEMTIFRFGPDDLEANALAFNAGRRQSG